MCARSSGTGRKEGGEIRQDLRTLLPEETRHPSVEFSPALGLGVVALDAGIRLNDLQEWPVADGPAKREGAAFQPADLLPHGLAHLSDKATLPETGLPDDDDDPALPSL